MEVAASVARAKPSFPLHTAAPKWRRLPPCSGLTRVSSVSAKGNSLTSPRKVHICIPAGSGSLDTSLCLASSLLSNPPPEQRGLGCTPRLEASMHWLPVLEPVCQRAFVVVFVQSGDQSVLEAGLLGSHSHSRFYGPHCSALSKLPGGHKRETADHLSLRPKSREWPAKEDTPPRLRNQSHVSPASHPGLGWVGGLD